MKTQDQINQERNMLLHTPHNIMIVDQVIDIKAEAFSSTVTLGYHNPAGQIQAAVTLQMPTNFLKTLADEIAAKLKENSPLIKAEYQKFVDTI